MSAYESISMTAQTEITTNNSILNSAFDKYYYLFI